MIVWGGVASGANVNDRRALQSHREHLDGVTTTGAPTGRSAHTAVWTGSEMIVWGGAGGFPYLNDGGRYNPATNSWTAVTPTDAPEARGTITRRCGPAPR